jgi:hypothetical protein
MPDETTTQQEYTPAEMNLTETQWQRKFYPERGDTSTPYIEED